VQPKAIAHPTDARLIHRALVKLVALAGQHGVRLRQSYPGRQARRHHGRRYSHAHQYKRRQGVRFLRTRLGRVIRDIIAKIKGRRTHGALPRSSI
jgi:IS5 family transposase